MLSKDPVKDKILEFTLRCSFNILLLTLFMFPLFGIVGSLGVTIAIVVFLEFANRGFTKLWSIA